MAEAVGAGGLAVSYCTYPCIVFTQLPLILPFYAMATTITFETTLSQMGNNTGIAVPAQVIEQLGAGKKPPVKVTLNGFAYQSTVGIMGGTFLIPVSAAIRHQAGVLGGDPITVSLSLDSEPRTVNVPAGLQQALDNNALAKASFEDLSYSAKKSYVALVEEAKTNETRQKRIEKTIRDLAVGKK